MRRTGANVVNESSHGNNMNPANDAHTKEWFFDLDWNNPRETSQGYFAFHWLGIVTTWDRSTWMFHVCLLLIVIRIGRVDIDSSYIR